MTIFRSFRQGAAAVVLAGAMTFGASAPVQAADTVNFAMPSIGMLYLPVYVAEQMGYFTDADIDANLQVFKAGGGTAMAAVLGGDMDVYIGSTSAALRAAAQDTNTVIIGALMTQYASNVVMRGALAREKGLTADSSVAERLAALKGALIGVTGAGSGTHQLALYMLTEAGLDPERDATVVFVGGGSEILAAFSRDRIDAFTLSNPTSDTAIANYDGFLLFNTAAGQLPALDGHLYISVNTRQGWINEKPEVAKRMMSAIQRAQMAMHDPEQTEAIRDKVYAAYFPKVEKPLFDQAWTSVLPAYPTSPEITREQMERVVTFLDTFSEKKLDGLDIDAAFTNDMLDSSSN
ncbi:ABC transporter substrate-binding protein [Puniceibacterium sp. IMCC21224]|uniref:ABC transporter substrate-binding protein n=1 Tax=Puniceibacterium sp. IMCC21224 TaxID=1618204 RepID=UPI00064D82C2|nr:ABC transporter substrate-binding protein [Puniceibacterium sp. IMCC21224]KMK64888.1 ABC-type nitrate/sulfonate/bicarbonate transport system, periplasmic component [Puniceibacterium sp. IMCC21224]